MRNPKTLEKLDQWILAFSTPYHCALYHSRLLWFHQNAKINSPLSPRSLQDSLSNVHVHPSRPRYPPAPGHLDPQTSEDLHARVKQYTIFTPRQHAITKLYIPPFPPTILHNLWWHYQWTKPDEKGRVAYPVMISLDTLNQKWFSAPLIWEFLKKDGQERGLHWDVYDSQSGVQRMLHATYEPSTPDSSDIYESAAVNGTGSADSSIVDREKWMIRFRREDEAKRFIRRWDRRGFGKFADDGARDTVWHVEPVLKVEQLW